MISSDVELPRISAARSTSGLRRVRFLWQIGANSRRSLLPEFEKAQRVRVDANPDFHDARWVADELAIQTAYAPALSISVVREAESMHWCDGARPRWTEPAEASRGGSPSFPSSALFLIAPEERGKIGESGQGLIDVDHPEDHSFSSGGIVPLAAQDAAAREIADDAVAVARP